MKIAIIGQKGIPALAGGVERHVEEIAVRMAKKGHAVTVYVRNSYAGTQRPSLYQGVRLIHQPSIPTKHLDAITHTLLATLHALFQQYDVIHFHSIGPSILSFIVRILKRRTRLVATFHSRDYFHRKWGPAARIFLKLGEYLICTVPEKTVVLTRSQQEYVRRTYGQETVVIPNGYGIEHDPGTGELASWSLTPGQYVLSVCRLIPHKGVHYLIEAFARLEDAGRVPAGFKLVITGSGFHSGDYEEGLHGMSRGRESIVFTGTQGGATLRQLYSHARLFVQPSDSEGLSIALLEAMGCGTAPLVSSIPENLEPLHDLGFSFQAGNVGDLQQKLDDVLHGRLNASAMGRRVRELAEREYNWDNITERYLRLYTEP